MLSKVACARRVCLSCQYGVAQRIAARPRLLPLQRDLGQRWYASNHFANDNVLEAMMSGRRSAGQDLQKQKKRGKGRRQKRTNPRADTNASWWEPEEAQLSQSPQGQLLAKSPSLPEQRTVEHNPFEEEVETSTTEKVPSETTNESAIDESSPHEESTEPPVDKTFPTEGPTEELSEEVGDADHPIQRVTSRGFSPDDFSQWAAGEGEPSSEVLKHFQDTWQPYVVGKTRLDRQNVGVGALGQRFNALVMKDPDTLGHNEGRIVTAAKDLPPSIPFDLEGFAPAEIENMEPDEEAFENLDALRPTDSSTLTRHDFESLRDLIADGFNGSQLVMYWRTHRDPEEKPAYDSATYPWLQDLGTWTPVDQDGVHKLSREKKAKRYYAYRILTRIWGLQIQEEVEIPGRVVAKLRNLPHTLITRPSIGILDQIQADLLDETAGEKITSIKAHRTLEIVARKPVVPFVLAQIDSMLQALARQAVSLEGVDKELLRKEALDELEKVTKTIILTSPSPESTHIDVCWPRGAAESGEALQSNTETPGDIVRRLLLGRQTPVVTTEEQVIGKRFRGEGIAAKAGTLTPYHRENRSMSWKNRLASWTRLVTPVVVPAELKKNRQMKVAGKVTFPHMDEISKGSPDTLVATFGHILHAPTPKAKGKGKGRTTKTYRRALSPIVPHPAAFTELAPGGGEITRDDSMVMHFIPSPEGTGGTGPPLKLTVPFTGDEDFSNFSLPSESTLAAPRSPFIKDLLFPENTVDVRVERRQDLPLDLNHQSAFKDFISASEFNLDEGRLLTPSSANFTLPKSWLTKPGLKADTSEETIEVPYLFGGLEMRQSISMPWQDGTNLRYESVEAGQHSGTRQELSFVLDLVDKSRSEVEASVNSFLTLLGDAVEGKCWSWSQGVSKVHELPPQDDPVWDQFRPQPSSSLGADESQEQSIEQTECEAAVAEVEDELSSKHASEIEMEAPIDVAQQRETTEETVVPRSEPVDWDSAPLAPPSNHQARARDLGSQED